jgi:hypothetical protein
LVYLIKELTSALLVSAVSAAHHTRSLPSIQPRQEFCRTKILDAKIGHDNKPGKCSIVAVGERSGQADAGRRGTNYIVGKHRVTA